MARKIKQRSETDWAEEAQRVARIGRAAEKELHEEWRGLVRALADVLVLLLLSRESVEVALQKLRGLVAQHSMAE